MFFANYDKFTRGDNYSDIFYLSPSSGIEYYCFGDIKSFSPLCLPLTTEIVRTKFHRKKKKILSKQKTLRFLDCDTGNP